MSTIKSVESVEPDMVGLTWEVRNVAKSILPNVYECEVNHPEHGWIPFSANPEDKTEHVQNIYKRIQGGEFLVAPYEGPSLEEADLALFRSSAVASEFQAKAALMQAGLLPDVEAFIAQADDLTKLAWQTAREFRRSSFLVEEMITVLGMTPEQMDGLFRFAMTIEV